MTYDYLSILNSRTTCTTMPQMFCTNAWHKTDMSNLLVQTMPSRQRNNALLRHFHVTASSLDKSKVEDSLKEKLKQKESVESATTVGTPVESSSPPGQEVAKPVKKPLWDRFVAEVKHYYHGFRLMGLDIRIASKTLWKILRGKTLTRRERNQFKRAVSDIFRLAPFSVFIIIPFAELALPVVVSLFPSLLPSTFEDKQTRETRLKKNLKVKLEMAKFMQDAVEEIAMRSKNSSKENQATQDFAAFFQKIRTSDEDPTNEEILKHAKLFEDELTLDSMSRLQLVALCRLIQVPAVGSNNLLRFLLKMKLRRLHADDDVIQREGIDNLTVQELQTACQNRGMRALGMSKERLKAQLQQWIDLHLNHDVPSSLLLLSRVLFMPENVPAGKLVKEAISALSDKAADEAEVRAAELNCERVDNTKRYKVTKQEELDIAKEAAEEKIKEEHKKMLEEQKKKQEESEKMESATKPTSLDDTITVTSEVRKVDTAPILSDKAPILDETSGTVLKGEAAPTEGPTLVDKAPTVDAEITREEIDALDKAIGIITKDDLEKTKSELEDLREDLVEYQQDMMSLDKNLTSEKDEIVMKDKRTSTRLQKRIARFIGKMDDIVKELEEKQSTVELTEEGSDEKQSISVEELKTTLRSLGDISEEKLTGIAHVLDANKDGEIDLKEVLLAIEALDNEDVSVTHDQLHHLIGLVQQTDANKDLEKLPEN